METVKYSILMPYYDRLEQLRATLWSLVCHYGRRSDVEIILVEDAKNDDAVFEAVSRFQDLSTSMTIKHIRHATEVEHWTACSMYNRAADVASGAILLVTNPECLHLVDVLHGLDVEYDSHRDCYVVCSCALVKRVRYDIDGQIASLRYDQVRWLQHSVRHHRMLNYCNAVTTDRYRELGGFDERLSEGYAFGDNDFRDRIVLSGVEIVNRDDLVTLHIQHKPVTAYMSENMMIGLHQRNKKLYTVWRDERGHYSQIMKAARENAKRTESVG